MSIQVECRQCRRRAPRGTSLCPACSTPMREGRGVVFWVDATDGAGRRVRRRIGRDLSTAELVDSEIAVARLKGLEYAVKRQSNATLASLCQQYALSPACTQNADARVRLGFLGRICERLGDSLPANSLTPATIHRYQEARLGQGATGTTINHETGYLHIMLEWAARTGLIEVNPIEGYERLPSNPARERTLTDSEYRAIVEHLAPHVLPLFELRYRLPFRGHDVLGLQIQHVHLEDRRGYIEVPGASAKSGKPRIIPLWWPHLRAVLAAVVSGRTDGPLWLYQGRPLTTWRTAFVTACRNASVAGFQERDLRHCAITSLVLRGVPLHELAYASDHASLLIQRRYTNLTQHLILARPAERYNPVTGTIEPTGGKAESMSTQVTTA